MDRYCHCSSRGEETRLRDNTVVCSDCDKPICCDVAFVPSSEEPSHRAEVINQGYFLCADHSLSLAERLKKFQGSAQGF